MQFLVFFCIFVGEALMVYAELLSAKLFSVFEYSFAATVALSLIPGILGAVLLVVGYALGLKLHHNIWAVSAISLGAFLIVEPLLNVVFIGQVPQLGSGIGFAFGVLGILAVTFL